MPQPVEDRTDLLVAPHGGTLINLCAAPEEVDELVELSTRLPSLQLSDRCTCDLELLAVGGFSPLDRFMGRNDYRRVLDEMRLERGILFPIPVTLPVHPEDGVKLDTEIALRDPRNNFLGIMRVDEIYPWDPDEMARQVLGTTDSRHPLVAEMQRWGHWNISGPVRVARLPVHYDFPELRLDPRQTRERLARMGRRNVVAFQTRNPLHRVHEELTRRAADEVDGVVLLHPSVGMTRPGDVDHYTRVRTYRALTSRYYDPERCLLSLLPLAMRMAGPREAAWHAIIRKNYGASHFIVGRDHAGPGNDSQGKPFYGPFEAQELAEKHQEELGVKILPFPQLVYVPSLGRYEEAPRVAAGVETLSLSGTQVREALAHGRPLPDWFTRPEVSAILAEAPARYKNGFCVWLTGLVGSGKAPIAGLLTVMLLERGRHVTLLEGDEVRTLLSKGLTFSRRDRDMNIRRIGFVAQEIVANGGAAVCSTVSPYQSTRDEVRTMMPDGHFIEVWTKAPLEVCEQRDRKGVYARARRGEVQGLTGVDDPYESPRSPELVLDTVALSPEECARLILERLEKAGWVDPVG